MLIYGSDLAILPFRQGEEIDVIESTTPSSHTPLSSERRGDILPSFTVSLRGLNEVVNNVKDFQLLCGYNNPTVFILYEATPTWAGSVYHTSLLSPMPLVQTSVLSSEVSSFRGCCSEEHISLLHECPHEALHCAPDSIIT